METLELFPSGSYIDDRGRLWLGGCLASSLAQEFGTPLYVFDEATLRSRCREYSQHLSEHYPADSHVAYASKACLNVALAQLFAQEGLDLDVVSGGELYVASQAGFPAERIHFHGNNKSAADLESALNAGVGRIVVDNFHELDMLEGLASQRGIQVPIWLRLSPGVDVHTHAFRKTGLLDSKFGFPLDTDVRKERDPAGSQAERAVARAMTSPHLELAGLHAHIGSQVFEVEPFKLAVSRLLDFAGLMRDKHGFVLREFSPGGGWGVPYCEEDHLAPVTRFLKAVCEAVITGCQRHKLGMPTLVIEPGRSIVAPSAVALYRVGARKKIPGVRTYVSVDGGMADNIRPALYGARYTAVVANKADQPADETVTIAGMFCESGDVLIRDISLPRLAAGDLLAIPRVGAYCLPLACNYNLAPRPAVILVKGGRANLIQRRETFGDLTARDMPLPSW